jgi:hypothetical protein
MMGFVRRGESPLKEHELSVRDEDERMLTWRELSRLVARRATPPVGDPELGTRVGTFSLAPFIEPQVAGLAPAFPTIIINVLEFGEDITF